ncbi:hypothetical protein [Myroides pelagicus]|uniref:Uncharacterized protein n=1 Tax=Myroides pelagicus TaxID=270914 RepID=A0A7K1GM64_9FLAO|nr:hypothetical protein [Myroides pelagicus]MEC4115118.1 hypothetical protein [Myroides pelagicus]MTH29629.1 hypothetical protein [Myroides pelagicus]
MNKKLDVESRSLSISKNSSKEYNQNKISNPNPEVYFTDDYLNKLV